MARESRHRYAYCDDPIEDNRERNRTWSSALALAASVVVGMIFLGSTYAANVNLNGGAGSSVEFGQGVNKMTACDGNITMKLESGFLNSSGAGAYGLTGINLSEIDSSDQGCANKDFIIKAYYRDINAPQGLIDSYTAITVRDYGTRFSISAITGATLISTSNSAFTLNFDASRTLLESSRISSITLESMDHVYSVGATGPGGGVIFYISKSPFSCGPTLSDLCNALEYSPGGSISGQLNSRWAPQSQPSVLIGSTAQRTAIGTGFANSVAIVNQYTNVLGATQSTYQAGIARLYSAGALSDWYMPSKDEIVELYNYAVSNNFYSSMAYFNSSSEVGASANWGLYFAQRNQVPTQTGSKLDNNPTWPIRAFMAPQTN